MFTERALRLHLLTWEECRVFTEPSSYETGSLSRRGPGNLQLGVSALPLLHLKKQPILSKQSFSATIKLRSSLTELANPYGWANPSLLEVDVPQV